MELIEIWDTVAVKIFLNHLSWGQAYIVQGQSDCLPGMSFTLSLIYSIGKKQAVSTNPQICGRSRAQGSSILLHSILSGTKSRTNTILKNQVTRLTSDIKVFNRVWREGPGVKSTSCSCQGPGLGSQHPHDSSQHCITPVPGDMKSSSGFHRHQVCMWCTQINIQARPIYSFKKNLKN